MRKALMLCAACLAMSWTVRAGDGGQSVSVATPEQDFAIGRTSAAEALEAAFQQIEMYGRNQWDVTQEMYSFYYKLDKLVNPQFYLEDESRLEGSGALDQLLGTCPGSSFTMPEEGELTIRTCGNTSSSSNHCSYPYSRYGRDVVAELIVPEDGSFEISTCGSRFDTYLTLFRDACCGDGESIYWDSNDNNPFACSQRLASYMFTCVPAGTYYLVVDGASPAAHGSYCLSIYFTDFCDD